MDELLHLSALRLSLVAVIVVAVLLIKFWKDIRGTVKSLFKKEEPETLEISPPLGSVATVYLSAMTLTVKFAAVHARKEDKIGEALLSLANTVRAWSVGSRSLILDFSQSPFINSMCMVALITLLNDIVKNNGLMLVFRIPETSYSFRTFGEQLRIMSHDAPHIKIEGVKPE